MGGGGFGVSIFFLAGSVPGGGVEGGSGALACRKSGMPIYPIFLLTRY